jgi:hypothetical protein
MGGQSEKKRTTVDLTLLPCLSGGDFKTKNRTSRFKRRESLICFRSL